MRQFISDEFLLLKGDDMKIEKLFNKNSFRKNIFKIDEKL